MPRLQDKLALVTGATGGIGRGIVRRFAREGAHVLATDQNEQLLSELADDYKNQGLKVSVFPCDLATTAAISDLKEQISEAVNGLDIIVNNAGIPSFGRSLEDDDFDARVDMLLNINIKSILTVCSKMLPLLVQRGGGSIINIASVQATATFGDNSAYAATKGALVAGTRGLAVELAPKFIRVNTISPGTILKDGRNDWILREFGKDAADEFRSQFGEWQDKMRTSGQPLPVAGSPDDVASLALFLASDESRFCTGADYLVDGGASALLANPGSISDLSYELHGTRKAVQAWVRAKRSQ